MKITISGTPGSGKSTVAKKIAKKLNMNHFSAGEFQRAIAKEKGETLLQLAEEAEQSREIDERTDSWIEAIGEADDNFVMEGRLAFNFIPDSIKIFLDVSEDEAARRIFHDLRIEEKENITQAVTFENIKKRKKSEMERYGKYYNLNYTNPDNYDIVIDTTELSVKEVVDKIVDFVTKKDMGRI